ncbi:MAG: hypothetical protein RMJ56_17555 [Gemmataceae bacterium]|nr:hypothetical protein [Gemmata sp.]MDW8199404.1 hypothetical protein [Gemmataceae bacterium]
MKGKPSLSLDIKVEPVTGTRQWAITEWTYVSWNLDAAPIQTVKVKVLHFAEDVPVGPNNTYDVVPPEGAKVGRSHYELPKGQQDPQIDFYQYVVKDGKLVQTAGPTDPLYWVRRNWRWLALVVVSVLIALVIRRTRRDRRNEPVNPTG